MTQDGNLPGGAFQRLECTFDDGASGHRIGLITFETDTVTERDFHLMLPQDGEVAFYTVRLPNSDAITIESLREMGDLLGEAARRIARDSRIDVVAYGCTSGTITLGFDEVVRLVRQGRPGVAVVTPITAALKAFEKLSVRRIALLTPYSRDLNGTVVDHLSRAGIEVVSVGSFDLESEAAMARVTPQSILEASKIAARDDVDALFVSCTSLRSTETIAAMEEALQKPVVTSVQCLVWDALRTSGYEPSVRNFGRLLL